YCSSLIAGLEAGKTPITSQFGVYSRGAVMSVFVEPVIHKESHLVFWNQLRELWVHRHPEPLAALQHHDCHGTILLRSSGESAQSVWMFRVLCAMAGFDVKVLSANEQFTSPNPEKPLPEARLYIGDAALFQLKNTPNALRLDVGEIWNSHTGHRAWFAGWFEGGKASPELPAALEKTLNLQLNAWNESSEFARWCRCFVFLETQKQSQMLAPQTEEFHDLRELLSDYFNCIEHKINADEGRALLHFYQQMQNAFAAWQQRRSPENCTIPSAKTSAQIHAITHLAST
ncbi:MAG: Menaquinone biosynthesis, partial [Pseudomonadota bacterium]